MNKADKLEAIAQNVMNMTLKPQNSDELDFHDLSCWDIKRALEAAYEAGRAQR